ncbi:DUF6338 family protein [Halorubrum xinjiangense]|uniref:DUF6338 family protein n=1 Tax=Halorubrum xinjiangense TaxID=261291 RepID=UPI003C6F7C56
MVSFNLPLIDLVYAFFVLVPGFVTYRVGRYVGKVTVNVDRFDKTAYTLVSSGIALSLLVLTYALVFDQPLESVVTTEYSLGELGLAYLVLLTVAAVNGYVSGWFIDNKLKQGLQTRREKTWEIMMDGAERPIEARVVTTEGREIHGYINVYDTQDHGKDVLLEYPQTIIRDADGGVWKTESIGDHAFVNEADISHIYIESEVNV